MRALLAFTPLCFLINIAGATAEDEEKSSRGLHGQVSISYQRIHVDGFESSDGFLGTGEVDTHSIYLEVSAHLTDRLSATVGLPWITKRYGGGPFAHDPTAFTVPRDSEFIDDTKYHGDFQDVYAELSYRVTDGPVIFEPFVSIGVPTKDYPFFGEAAVGQRLFRFALGGRVTYLPHFDDYYISASVARGFADPPLNYDVNHWLLNLEAGYYLTPRFIVNALVQAKQGNGIEFPKDFDTTDPGYEELLYQHDRLLKLNYINVGVGGSYVMGDKNAVSVSVMRQIRGVSVLKMEYAVTIGFSRSF